MDDTVDYAALVDNYLADERLARQLQDEEQNVVTSRSSLPPITQRIMTSVTRMSERDHSPITISSEDDEQAYHNREQRRLSEELRREPFDQLDEAQHGRRMNSDLFDLFEDSDSDESMGKLKLRRIFHIFSRRRFCGRLQ